VQNVEAHNFAVDWKFGEILGETGLGRCPVPVHRRRVFDCVGMVFLLHCLNKTPTILVKVAEGSLISNFASDPKVQFSLKNWRKTILKTDQ
jgi:hypothetical protein